MEEIIKKKLEKIKIINKRVKEYLWQQKNLSKIRLYK